MITINLLPVAKKKKGPSFELDLGVSRGASIVIAGMVGLIAFGGLGYYELLNVEEATVKLQAQATQHRKRADEIRKLIDEEALEARKQKVEDIKAAITSLEAERKTPAFVMFELASVLSSGKLPEIDEEKQRKLEATDPQAKLNPSWDATSVWMTEIKEEGNGVLKLAGAARDPADIDEFVKRLRASVRFRSVSHPQFIAKADPRQKRDSGVTTSRQYDFTLTTAVSFWD